MPSDATAYDVGDLASHHISCQVCIDAQTKKMDAYKSRMGGNFEEILPHTDGVVLPHIEDRLTFDSIVADAGDMIFFDSFIPHRSDQNISKSSRRLAYLTYNATAEGALEKATMRRRR